MKTFQQFNESVRSHMTPKSNEDIRNVIKRLVGTEGNHIEVEIPEPKDVKKIKSLLELSDKYNLDIKYSYKDKVKVCGDITDIFDFIKFYVDYTMINRQNRRDFFIDYIIKNTVGKVDESVRDKMTPKSKEDIKSITNDISRQKMFNGFLNAVIGNENLDLWFELGVDIDMVNDNGSTVLHELCWMDGVGKIMKRLLDLGANPNLLNKAGMTPLMIAVQNTNISVVRIILDSKSFKPYEHKQLSSAIYLTKKYSDVYPSSRDMFSSIRKVLNDYKLKHPLT